MKKLNLQELAEWLRRVTYKPNFKCKVYITGPVVRFAVEATFPDVDDPTKTVTLTSAKMVEPDYDEIDLKLLVSYMFRDIEEHEFHEWLRLDGVRLTNPHEK